MKKIILTLAIAALSATFVAQTQAAPKADGAKGSSVGKGQSNSQHTTSKSVSGSPHSVNKADHGKFKDYHLQHGTKFEHGVFYKGKHHEHWGQTRWDARYGCNCYFDSCLSVWYYWCERDICYYPVSYCPYRCYTCTEVVVAPQPVVVVPQPVVVVPQPVIVVVRPVCVEYRPIITCNTCASVLPCVVLRVGCESPIQRVGSISYSLSRR